MKTRVKILANLALNKDPAKKKEPLILLNDSKDINNLSKNCHGISSCDHYKH